MKILTVLCIAYLVLIGVYAILVLGAAILGRIRLKRSKGAKKNKKI